MKKKWIYLLVAGWSVATIATADAQRGPFGALRGEAMMDELGLSDEQKMQVKQLRETHRKEMQALRASGERPGPEKMEQLFAAHREQVEKVLTAEQREQMEQLRGMSGPAMHGRGGRGMGGPAMHDRGWGRGGRGKGGPAMHGRGGDRRGLGHRPFAQLNLSDEQMEQIRGLRQKQREAMQALTKKHREAVEKVLTKEQRSELEEMKDEAFYHRAGRRGRW